MTGILEEAPRISSHGHSRTAAVSHVLEGAGCSEIDDRALWTGSQQIEHRETTIARP